MKYEIQYKCQYVSGLDSFPILKIRYRKHGIRIWNRLEKSLDVFAKHMGLYGEVSSGYLEFLDTWERAFLFADILSDKFNGNIEEYVKKIVMNEVETEIYNNEIEVRTDALISSWTTSGWNSMELNVGKEEES